LWSQQLSLAKESKEANYAVNIKRQTRQRLCAATAVGIITSCNCFCGHGKGGGKSRDLFRFRRTAASGGQRDKPQGRDEDIRDDAARGTEPEVLLRASGRSAEENLSWQLVSACVPEVEPIIKCT